MILERRLQFNIPELLEQNGHLFENIESGGSKISLIHLAEFMQAYNAAMKAISTKLEVLDDEFQLLHKHNPIHHLESRVKSPKSIHNKMIKDRLALSLENIRENVYDIAGIRVICNFLDDIYAVENLLIKQADVTLIKRKDYIAEPKENGYRSLHIVVKVPVFLSSKTEEIPVEIQLRTIAMDYWASLEHKLRYKSNGNTQKYAAMLLDCANALSETEREMLYIRECIEEYKQEEVLACI